MKKVDHLNQFPSNSWIAQFFGVSYDEAVEKAKKMLSNPTHYFEQAKIGKSSTILVSYEKVTNEPIRTEEDIIDDLLASTKNLIRLLKNETDTG